MSICAFNVQLKGRKVQGTICGLLFMILSVVVYKAGISGGVIPFVMGLLACVAVILMVAGVKEDLAEAWILLQNTQCRFF